MNTIDTPINRYQIRQTSFFISLIVWLTISSTENHRRLPPIRPRKPLQHVTHQDDSDRTGAPRSGVSTNDKSSSSENNYCTVTTSNSGELVKHLLYSLFILTLLQSKTSAVIRRCDKAETLLVSTVRRRSRWSTRLVVLFRRLARRQPFLSRSAPCQASNPFDEISAISRSRG